jgi:hypothetical protein
VWCAGRHVSRTPRGKLYDQVAQSAVVTDAWHGSTQNDQFCDNVVPYLFLFYSFFFLGSSSPLSRVAQASMPTHNPLWSLSTFPPPTGVLKNSNKIKKKNPSSHHLKSTKIFLETISESF